MGKIKKEPLFLVSSQTVFGFLHGWQNAKHLPLDVQLDAPNGEFRFHNKKSDFLDTWRRTDSNFCLKIKCRIDQTVQPDEYKYYFYRQANDRPPELRKEDVKWLLDHPVAKFAADELWKYFFVPGSTISQESVNLHHISHKCDKTFQELTIVFKHKKYLRQLKEPNPTKTYFYRVPSGSYYPAYVVGKNVDGEIRVFPSPLGQNFPNSYHFVFDIWLDDDFENPQVYATSKVLEKDKKDFEDIQTKLQSLAIESMREVYLMHPTEGDAFDENPPLGKISCVLEHEDQAGVKTYKFWYGKRLMTVEEAEDYYRQKKYQKLVNKNQHIPHKTSLKLARELVGSKSSTTESESEYELQKKKKKLTKRP
eukprot:GHVP01006147.1.p1 GENE.GHVP01006147.1~~GHVP01006147.1.p1  ORF type:complete len:372 (-),score=58.65 GHVP01006147.1:64-1158(-)